MGERDGTLAHGVPSLLTETKVRRLLRHAALAAVDLLQHPRRHLLQPQHPLAATSQTGRTQKAAIAAHIRSADTAHLMVAKVLDGIMPHGAPFPVTQQEASQGWMRVVLAVAAIP